MRREQVSPSANGDSGEVECHQDSGSEVGEQPGARVEAVDHLVVAHDVELAVRGVADGIRPGAVGLPVATVEVDGPGGEAPEADVDEQAACRRRPPRSAMWSPGGPYPSSPPLRATRAEHRVTS